MLDELLLHVGPEKTGTTTIQTALASSAADLTAAGTFIPLATGALPGHHLPILREVVGDPEFESHYEYSQDVLSLEDTLGELADNGCTRMLLSAETFSAPSTHGDVLRLIRMIAPRKLTVLHTLRSAVPWLLSWHAQEIKYGLFERGSWPVDRFCHWFIENAFTVDVACTLWRQGSWEVELRTIVLPSGTDHDLARMFTVCADLPVPLQQKRPANRRMEPCKLRLLQALNVQTFDPTASLQRRAILRETVLTSLERHGVPRHECDCAVPLDALTQASLDSEFAGYLTRIVSDSGRVEGDIGALLGTVPDDDSLHSRYPTPPDALLCVPLLLSAVDDGIAAREETGQASDFWHAQADAYQEAREHERRQVESWQEAAGQLEEARDHWRQQAQSWQTAAGEFETARDFWHQQADNWQRLAEERSAEEPSA